MQTFKISQGQLQQMIQSFHNQRKQSLKSIKQFYSQIQQKQSNVFTSSVERIQKNLINFKQDKYKKMSNQIPLVEISQKYQLKISKIDNQIKKLQFIIKNGVGKIVEKAQTDRWSRSDLNYSTNNSRQKPEQNTYTNLDKFDHNINQDRNYSRTSSLVVQPRDSLNHNNQVSIIQKLSLKQTFGKPN